MLPRVSKQTLHRFLETVLEPEASAEPVAERLLDEKCTPNEIYLALVYCRNVMLMKGRNLPDRERIVYVKKLLLHHDRLTVFLMRAVEQRHEREWKGLQAELLREGHAHLLSRAKSLWSREQEIGIYNHYKEMPVFAVVKLLHAGEESLTIKRNREMITVFSASEDRNSAFTRLPNSELCMQLVVEEATQKTVHLRYGDFIQVSKEKRRDIRVQVDEPIPITVKDSGFQQWKGSVHDFSVSGLGLSFASETPFQTGDVLAFSLMLHGRRLAGKGTISWVHHSAGHCRAGMGIEYDQENHLRLANEVRCRQKAIMGELKLRGIPDSLLAG